MRKHFVPARDLGNKGTRRHLVKPKLTVHERKITARDASPREASILENMQQRAKQVERGEGIGRRKPREGKESVGISPMVTSGGEAVHSTSREGGLKR